MERIRELRKLRGLSQEELARIVGVERSTVSKWETGEAKPRADLFVKLAKTLHCKVDDLFLPENMKKRHSERRNEHE